MDGAQYLLTPEGWALVNSLPPYDPATADRLSAELRSAGHSPDLVSAALTQQRLRAHAHIKFADFAARMLFTDTGLQQATRLRVSALHAQRYRDAGCTHVVDLGCGLGGDALSLAALGLTVTAVERDELTAACATVNLMPFPTATVVHGDALAQDLSPYDGAFADPGRRTARGRTFDPRTYSPPLDSILDIRNSIPALGVKVAPGIPYEALPSDTHAQWVSVDGSVVEAGLWFGPLAASPGRSAVVISADTAATLETTTVPTSVVVPTLPGPLGRYLYEPDGAVIRAGGVGILAEQLDAAPVSRQIAYLTGDTLHRTPFAEGFEIEADMPLKQLAGHLREHGVGSLEIKKRGVDIVPDQYRKSLRLRGEASAIAILTRVAGKHRALIARRIAP